MEKIWLKNYPSSIPSSIPPLDKTLIEEFEQTCKKFQDKTAFVSFDTKMSYQELYEKSCQWTYWLKENGFEQNAVIVIQLPNLLQYPVTLWGSLMAGLKIVNMNPLYTAREMLHPIKETQAKGIVLLPNKLKELNEIIEQTQISSVIVTEAGDLLKNPTKHFINLVFKYKTKSWKPPQIKNRLSFLSAFKQKRPTPPPVVKRKENETVFIQYTGGTTGIIKGACLTEKNLLTNVKQTKMWMSYWLKEEEETALAALPLSHIFSFCVNGLVFFFCGYTNVLILNPKDINSLIKTMKKQKITIGTGVNTLFNALISHKKFKNIDFSHFKVFVSGGMSLEDSVRKAWESQTQSLLIEGYGLTEASPVVCVDRLDTQKGGSAGYPLPSTQIRITDENNNELGVNQIGELEVKGPQVMKGYYNQEQETKKVLSSDGWLKTGDIAKATTGGELQILGRKKELINISGLKVYPKEVEDVLLSYSKVKEAAVVGRSNTKGREFVKAFIIKKEEPLTEKEILSHCRKNLAPYKVPKEIVFLQKLFKKPYRQTFKKAPQINFSSKTNIKPKTLSKKKARQEQSKHS